jgi:hypothetical protein
MTLPAPLSSEGELPLSVNQRWRLARDRRAYFTNAPTASTHIPLVLRFEGPFDARALEHALGHLVDRHDILRTAFTMADGSPVLDRMRPGMTRFRQTIRPGVALPLQRVRIDARAPEQETLRLLAAEMSWPFDHGVPPLVRATLLQVSDRHHVLVLVMHHLVTDLISMKVVREELLAVYESCRRGRSPQLPAVRHRYVDFVRWEEERLRDAGDLLTFWRSRWLDWTGVLVDVRTLPFREADRESGGVRYERRTLAAGRSAEIKAGARRHRVTVYVLCLSALFALLSRYTGRPRVAIWLQFANRSRPEFVNLIGWCANSNIVGVEIAPGMRVRDLTAQVGDTLLQACAHEELPISVLWERCGREIAAKGSVGQAPYVSFDKRFELTCEIDGVRISMLEHQTTTDDNLNLAVCEEGGVLSLIARCRAERAGAGDLQRTLGHMEQLLAAMSDDTNPRVADLRLEDA